MGDYKLARKYYSESLNLNHENNIRALYGLWMVISKFGNVLIVDSVQMQFIQKKKLI